MVSSGSGAGMSKQNGAKRKPSSASKGRLTLKQEAFALGYCLHLNASDAYRHAYAVKKASAKTINEAACRLLKNSKIAARIEELMAKATQKACLEIERTLREVARVAYSDPRRFYDSNGKLKRICDLDDDTAATIAGVEVDEIKVDGAVIGHTVKVKTWDKNSALEKAMKYHGLYERDNEQKKDPLAELLGRLSGTALVPVKKPLGGWPAG